MPSIFLLHIHPGIIQRITIDSEIQFCNQNSFLQNKHRANQFQHIRRGFTSKSCNGTVYFGGMSCFVLIDNEMSLLYIPNIMLCNCTAHRRCSSGSDSKVSVRKIYSIDVGSKMYDLRKQAQSLERIKNAGLKGLFLLAVLSKQTIQTVTFYKH